MNRTKIEWTDYTWNPVTGCTKISQGCKNCYAERLTNRFEKVWGHSFSNVVCHKDRLMDPLYEKGIEGKRVFVCDMSDLFHEDVPDTFIHDVFETISNCPLTTFQILTKRPERALKVINDIPDRILIDVPFNNVWIGTSCEDQKSTNERIPFLLQIPAKVRFLSCEPLLGPIDLTKIFLPISGMAFIDSLRGLGFGDAENTNASINWVIAGGESGPKARPMHPDWVRSLRDQCKGALVPFFFKQWGEYLPYEPVGAPFFRDASTGQEFDGHGMNHIDPETCQAGKWHGYRWYDPMDSITLCMETKSSDCTFHKVGKHISGNLLDGKQYLEFPK